MDCVHRVQRVPCLVSSAAKRYKFDAIENDGQAFIDEMQKLCKVHDVAAVNHDALSKTCN